MKDRFYDSRIFKGLPMPAGWEKVVSQPRPKNGVGGYVLVWWVTNWYMVIHEILNVEVLAIFIYIYIHI